MSNASTGSARTWQLRAAGLLVALCAALGTLGLTSCQPARITYTYSIATRGPVHSDLNQFASWAHSVYTNSRGWSLNGQINFVQVPSGGNFVLVLATYDTMTSFSPECSPVYSCRVGPYVVINEIRWNTGTWTWGGPLNEYRDMVINHETGHWLGLGHSFCPAPGALAPLMQQQSKGLNGCRRNSWPTQAELNAVAGARGLAAPRVASATVSGASIAPSGEVAVE